ncbi:MAG: polyribonucleotide nucleotidyltransferase [Candidatus Eremiobacterota bacterium]
MVEEIGIEGQKVQETNENIETKKELQIEEVVNGNEILVEAKIAGRSLMLQTGTLAKQANGAVVVRYDDSLILATSVASDKPKEGIDFFPLTVNYEAKLYAAGKIPGGFFKREGKPSEDSILACRLIDRPIRPLFPEGLRNEVQIVTLVLSRDANEPDIVALIAASAALCVSDIPFYGPVGAVRIGLIDDELIINPTSEQLLKSKLDLVVSGTKDAITMVEARSNEVSEETIINAIEKAHEVIKDIVRLQERLIELAGKPKAEFPLFQHNKTLEKLMREHFCQELLESMQIKKKQERLNAIDKIKPERLISVVEQLPDEEERKTLLELLQAEKPLHFNTILDILKEEQLRKLVLEEGKRPDGRDFDEIRPLDIKVGLLPRTHGTGLFTRGETQVMTVLTLGTISEVQIIDDLRLEESKKFMHQYNFLPFCVGETGGMRGPGRREIGHGALAEKALTCVIPSEEEFPYTIRLVSEVLESNGSSSMASVCGSTLALMDGGVPIKSPVAGIAMGLISGTDKNVILTDIQGFEDAYGEMDFKVAGTREGITALQMDIKIHGISRELMNQALGKAKKARLFILDFIQSVMPATREDLSPYAPRVISMSIHPDKIREIIGPGGKMINKIIAETGAKIDLEDDGRVFISSPDKEAGLKARAMIENIIKDVVVGEEYKGKVVKIASFGAFVEIAPGKEGLLHISKLSSKRGARTEDVVSVGQEIEVKIAEIDYQGKINLDLKNGMPKSSYSSQSRSSSRPRDTRGMERDRDRERERDRDRSRSRGPVRDSSGRGGDDRFGSGTIRNRYR